LVPQIVFFGPAVPSRYSRQGFGPSNCLFRASSAFKIFEAGLRSLELSFLGQQCLQDIRGRASVPRIVFSGQQRFQDIRGRALVPRIVFFGPAAPSRYSRQGFGPLNRLFWPSDAFKVFELEQRTFESSLSSPQRHCTIWVWTSEPSKRIPRTLASSFCSSMGRCIFEPFFRAINAPHSTCPNHGDHIPVRMPYVKYEGKSTVCNT
jgi:hypothetical protein